MIRRTNVPAVIVGDTNLSAADLELYLAEHLDAEVVLGRGVDRAVLVGGVRLERVRRDLDKYESDHAPILLDVSVDGWHVRILWWNVYVGTDPRLVLRALRELVGEHDPDVILLGEAKRCRRVLSRLEGYRHRQGRRGEARNMAVLVRRDVRVVSRGWLRMREPWIGPVHDLPHGPRRYPRLRIADHDTRPRQLRILAVHLPTGGVDGRNSAAVLESLRRLRRWGSRSAP